MTQEEKVKLASYDARDARGEELSDVEFLEWERLIALDLEEKGI